MDIPRLAAMNTHWRHSPPVHIQLARFFGYERPKPSPTASQNSDDEMADFLGMLTHVQ